MPAGRAPPHQTVHSVFPSTAFRSSSSGGFRSGAPRGLHWYLEKPESVIEIGIGVGFVASAFLLVFTSQVNPHALLKKPSQGREISTTTSIVEISNPSANVFIDSLDDYLCRQRQSSPASEILDLRFDPALGFSGGPDMGIAPPCPRDLPHFNGEPQNPSGRGTPLNNSIGGEVKRVSVFGGQAFVKPLVYFILQLKVLFQRSAGHC